MHELLIAAAAAAADKVIDVKNSGISCPPSPQIQTGSNSSTAPGSPVVQLYPDQKSSICKLQAGNNSHCHIMTYYYDTNSFMIHTVISLLVQNSQLQGDTLFSASWRSVGTGTSRIYKFIVA